LARLWICIAIGAIATTALAFPSLYRLPATMGLSPLIYGLMIRVLGCLPLIALPFTWPRTVPRRFCVAYIPHLVAAVLMEYDRNTDASVVRSNLRQKFRRMSSLPVPDYDLIKFVSGSELVCEQILHTQNFFEEGAASCLLPS